jgi:hypothetical protein
MIRRVREADETKENNGVGRVHIHNVPGKLHPFYLFKKKL